MTSVRWVHILFSGMCQIITANAFLSNGRYVKRKQTRKELTVNRGVRTLTVALFSDVLRMFVTKHRPKGKLAITSISEFQVPHFGKCGGGGQKWSIGRGGVLSWLLARQICSSLSSSSLSTHGIAWVLQFWWMGKSESWTLCCEYKQANLWFILVIGELQKSCICLAKLACSLSYLVSLGCHMFKNPRKS